VTFELSSPRTIAAGQVVTPERVLAPGWVEVLGDRLVAVGSGRPAVAADVDLPDSIVIPGLIDTHVHGGGGASFSTTSPEEAVRVVHTHWAHGTTTMVASLVTAPLPELSRQVNALADLVEQGILGGIHLEGPWLSPQFKGAHDAASLSTPDPASVQRLLTAGRGSIRMVTIAPELDGALAAVRQLVDEGVVAAVGHTAADYALTKVAVDAGATVATHLFNAMPPLHHRQPGPVLALLEDERVTVEVIADGVHLHPSLALLSMRAAAGGFSLVTDAMAAAGAADGRYRLGGLDVEVREGRAVLAGTDTIAGSTMTMIEALRRTVGGGLPLAAAVHAASAGPAARLGLTDVGAIEAGRRADLVVLGQDLDVQRVMRRGEWQTAL
jgi:N-acetylglucosamine-6-phosphate deacetylase